MLVYTHHKSEKKEGIVFFGFCKMDQDLRVQTFSTCLHLYSECDSLAKKTYKALFSPLQTFYGHHNHFVIFCYLLGMI